MTDSNRSSSRELFNMLKAGMPWPEPGDGDWHWAMPAPRSMEKARDALQELEKQLEAVQEIISDHASRGCHFKIQDGLDPCPIEWPYEQYADRWCTSCFASLLLEEYDV